MLAKVVNGRIMTAGWGNVVNHEFAGEFHQSVDLLHTSEYAIELTGVERIDRPLEFEGVIFNDCTFDTFAVYGCSFRKCQFRNCRFDYVKIDQCLFDDCYFYQCVFNHAEFIYGVMKDVTLFECSVVETLKFNKVLLSGLEFKHIHHLESYGCITIYGKPHYTSVVKFSNCGMERLKIIWRGDISPGALLDISINGCVGLVGVYCDGKLKSFCMKACQDIMDVKLSDSVDVIVVDRCDISSFNYHGAKCNELKMTSSQIRFLNLCGFIRGGCMAYAGGESTSFRGCSFGPEFNLDYSGFPLTCMSFSMKPNDRLVYQLACHLARFKTDNLSAGAKDVVKLMKPYIDKFCEFNDTVDPIDEDEN